MYPANRLKAMFYTPPALTLDPRQYFISEPKPPRSITPNHTPLVPAPFAECPQDIARLIFEMAIMSSGPRLLSIQLTLVCRQVKEWLDPLIYRNISFTRSLSFHSFYWKNFREQGSSLSKDNAFYRKHVKGLFVHTYTDSSLLAAMISEMTGLESLSLTERNTGEDTLRRILRTCPGTDSWKGINRPGGKGVKEETFPFTNLRRLSFSSLILENFVIPKAKQAILTHPFFKDLTHIDIVHFSRFASWEDLRHCQNLTHLCFNDMASSLRHPSSRVWDSWIARLLKACPPSVKVVIFACVDSHNCAFYELDGDEQELDAWMLVEFSEFMRGRSVSKKPEYHFRYHAISRLMAGWIDPRAVVGRPANHRDLPADYPFSNNIINTSRLNDTDQRTYLGDELMQDRWLMAERLIRQREELKRSHSSA